MAELKKFKKLKRPGLKAQPSDTVYPALEKMIAEMRQLQDEGLANRNRFFQLETEVLRYLKEHGIEKYDHGPGRRATAVYKVLDDVDWDGIREAIGPENWEMILGEPQPVKKKLVSLAELGIIEAEVIEPFLKDKPSKPYVLI